MSLTSSFTPRCQRLCTSLAGIAGLFLLSSWVAAAPAVGKLNGVDPDAITPDSKTENGGTITFYKFVKLGGTFEGDYAVPATCEGTGVLSAAKLKILSPVPSINLTSGRYKVEGVAASAAIDDASVTLDWKWPKVAGDENGEVKPSGVTGKLTVVDLGGVMDFVVVGGAGSWSCDLSWRATPTPPGNPIAGEISATDLVAGVVKMPWAAGSGVVAGSGIIKVAGEAEYLGLKFRLDVEKKYSKKFSEKFK